MPTRDDKNKHLYLAIWRKSWQELDSLPIIRHFDSFAKAIAFRTGMYRAMKPYRDGEIMDGELKAISDKLSVNLIDKRGGVKISVKKPLIRADKLSEMFGLTAKDILSESEAKMMKLTKEVAPVVEAKAVFEDILSEIEAMEEKVKGTAGKPNPFY